MGNTDEDLPPSYGAEDQIMLLPPPYHGSNDDPTARNDGVVRLNNILPVSAKASGTISKYWKWIAEEVASSTERHRKSESTYIWRLGLSNIGVLDSDMCFGACCRG